jgi:voltage-gated potassium channel
MKKRVHQILSISNRKGDLSWYFDVFIITLIILNVIAIVLDSIATLRQQYHSIFHQFEVFSVVVFTIEYILRVWTANLFSEFKKPFIGNIKYALTPLAIADFLAIIPFYLPFLGVDLLLLRILRVFRIFRLFKIVRYVDTLSIFNRVFKRKKEELVISLVFTFFLLLVSSTVMYYVENEAQPESFSSIPQAMWWGITTLTTVGYGDMYPKTGLGQFLGGIISLIGIGLIALPVGILASGFTDEIVHRRNKSGICPTCGQPFKSHQSEH